MTVKYFLKSPSKIDFTSIIKLNQGSGSGLDSDLLDGLHGSAYEQVANKGVASGYASLDAGGKVPSAQLPALALTDIWTVASEAAQLALVAQEGDVAIRTDQNKSYVHNGGTAGTMADWSELLSPTAAVSSVFGRVGAVVATEGDYTLNLLGDVVITTPTAGQGLRYNGTSWVNAQFAHGDLSGIGTNTHAQIDTHLGASSGVHGISGSVVGTTDTQTLLNKLLQSPKIKDEDTTPIGDVLLKVLDQKLKIRNAGDTADIGLERAFLDFGSGLVNADIATGAGIVEAKLSLNYATHSNANDPTADEKSALAGTNGTPSGTNKYVTNSDPRNTDSRTPTSHKDSHKTGGSDALLVTDLLDAIARVTARKNTGTDIGSRRRFNFIEGSNVTLTVADDPTNEEIDITIASSGGGAVTSVFGRTGAVVATEGDYTLDLLGDVSITTPAQGDILVRDATGWTRLAAGTSGYFLKTQGAGANPVWSAGGGGSSDFLGLTDTPSAYTGQGKKLVRVNAGATALEFLNELDKLLLTTQITVGASAAHDNNYMVKFEDTTVTWGGLLFVKDTRTSPGGQRSLTFWNNSGGTPAEVLYVDNLGNMYANQRLYFNYGNAAKYGRLTKDTDGFLGLEALGTDTNIDLEIRPKGTGKLIIGGSGTSASGEGHITLLPWAYNAITQGTWTFNVNTNQATANAYYNSTAANLDQLDYKIYLAPGTYSLSILSLKSSNRGIMDILLDGTSLGTADMYSATTVQNSIVSITGIAVSTGGLKTLSVKVNGKNASSAGYIVDISVISLWRTA